MGGSHAHEGKSDGGAVPPSTNHLATHPPPDTDHPPPRSPRTDAVVDAATLAHTDSFRATTSPCATTSTGVVRAPSRSASNRSERDGGDSAFVRAARRQSLSQRVARGGGGLAKRLRAAPRLVASCAAAGAAQRGFLRAVLGIRARDGPRGIEGSRIVHPQSPFHVGAYPPQAVHPLPPHPP